MEVLGTGPGRECSIHGPEFNERNGLPFGKLTQGWSGEEKAEPERPV
jgi:hypothetical protein